MKLGEFDNTNSLIKYDTKDFIMIMKDFIHHNFQVTVMKYITLVTLSDGDILYNIIDEEMISTSVDEHYFMTKLVKFISLDVDYILERISNVFVLQQFIETESLYEGF